MVAKEKAVKHFLRGLSRQIPATAIGPLVEKSDNDAISILLNSSIEALPMGSPIRKSVDENIYQCVLWLKEEMVMRKRENSEVAKDLNFSQSKLGEGGEILPVMNRSMYDAAYNQATGAGDSERSKALMCTNYATPELFVHNLKDGQNIGTILNSLQKSHIAGQLDSFTMAGFLKSFKRRLDRGNESTLVKMKSLRALIDLSMILFSADSALLRNLDKAAAQELGNIAGRLVIALYQHPEEYKTTRKRDVDSSTDTDSDNDEEDVEKCKKIYAQKVENERKLLAKERQADATFLLLRVYTLLKSQRVKAADFALGYVNAILSHCKAVPSPSVGKSSNNKQYKTNLSKEASFCLIHAMETSGAFDRCDLPSTKLISDGFQRCKMVQKLAERYTTMAESNNTSQENDALRDEGNEKQISNLNSDTEMREAGKNQLNGDVIVGHGEEESNQDEEDDAELLSQSKPSRVSKISATYSKLQSVQEETAVTPRPESFNVSPSSDLSDRETPTKVCAKSSAPLDTPSRSTRSRNRKLPSSLVKTSGMSEDTPSKKRLRNSDVLKYGTPQRRSSRRKDTSDTESVNDSLPMSTRRSARKK